MFLALLALLFVVGPITELYVIVQVSHVIGGWETIALLLVESVLGAWLMKRQGRGVLHRIQTQIEANHLPTKELVDGGLIIFAGALMLTPGFLTDLLGFVLLIPPSRAVVRALVMRRITARLGTGFTVLGGAGRLWTRRPGRTPFDEGDGEPGGVGDVYDTTAKERIRSNQIPPGERP